MTTPIYTNKTSKFIDKAKIVHGEYYNYSLVVYVSARKKVNFICPEHGSFHQTPNNHLNGQNCPKCSMIDFSNNKIKSTEWFINKSHGIHGNIYDYSLSIYKKSINKVKIICPSHGVFLKSPNKHINGQGCPKCTKQNYSKVSIKWLNSINKDIQYAENGGEYRIPNTRYHVDGFCKETNTVYEFHGDKFHGNPELFKPTDNCHPFNKDITAKELYNNTIKKEEYIKSLGYNLVVMWEQDYTLTQSIP